MIRLTSVSPAPASVTRHIDSPCRGVVLLDYALAAGGVALHWRAGDWSKPPLDVSVDPATGRLVALQYVLQDERLPVLGPISQSADRREGVPIFDLSAWAPDERYVDEVASVSAGWVSSTDMVIRLAEARAAGVECAVSPELSLLFEAGGMLVAVLMRSITDEEKGTIARAEGA
jgi:hypothetical protein